MIDYIKKIATKPFVKDYFKIFSVDVLVKASGIILLPVYLKLMTQEEFGLYGYLVAIISTFALVFNLGIYTAQSKLYHEYAPEKRGEVLYTLNLILLIFISILLASLILFDLDFPVVNFFFKTPLNYSQYRFPVLLGVVVSVYSMMLVNFFLTSEDLKKVQIFNIARIILVNALVIGTLYFSNERDGTLTRLTYSNLVELFIIVGFASFYIRKMKPLFNKQVAIKAIAISTPILVSALLGIFINLSDRFFLEKFGTLSDLAIYNVALSIAGVVPFVFTSFQNIWLPQFLKERNFESNRARSKKMVLRLSIAFVGLSVLIIVAFKIMLIFSIIDDKYVDIMPLLPLVLITSIVSSLTGMYSNHLIYLDKLHIIIVTGVPIAILGVILNYNLVPSYSIYGAALSSFIANLCFLISYALMARYFYNKKSKVESSF